ncbi:MAG: MATE family efflux transporter [Myxococcota bacterium]|jgi:putative MATE family efflux protein
MNPRPDSGRPARGWRNRDHTRGSLLVSLFVLALPLVATSLAGVVFQLVDLGLISRLGEDATTAIIVSNQSLRQIVLVLAMGASFGAQGLVSQFVGSGRVDAAEHVAGQVVLLGGVFSVAIAGLGVWLPEVLLGWLNVAPDVMDIGVGYVRLSLGLNLGFVFLILFGAILNGAGDTTTPLVVSLVQTVLSIGAEWILIFGNFGFPALGVEGAALGLAVGQIAAGGIALWVLFRGRSRVHLRRRHLRPDPAVFAKLFRLSWPPALQMMGGFAVTAYFIRMMGGFGETAQAAYSIGLRLSMIGPMLAFPIAGAAATLVGQALGAGNPQRAWRSIFVTLCVHAPLLWVLALAGYVFRFEIMQAFSSDPDVVALGAELLAYQAASFFFLGINFVLFRALQGAGDVMVPMWMSLANALLITLTLGLWLTRGLQMGPTGIFIANLAGAATATLFLAAWTATGRWTHAVPRPLAIGTPPSAESGRHPPGS